METNNMMPMLEDYLQDLKVRNLSDKTVRMNRWQLNKFIMYLENMDIRDLSAVGKENICAYQVVLHQAINMKGRPNSVSYQNNMLSAVKQFFKFLYRRDYIAADPTRDIRFAKKPRQLPRSILNPKEARKIIHAPDLSTLIGYRDRTIMEVLYSSGIRKEELNHLKIHDVDYADGYLRVHQGKGRKDRIVPIGKIACRYLENYIRSIRPELVKDPANMSLFLSLRGNPLSKNIVWNLVKKYAKQVKIKKNIHPHTFRHSCATSMLRNKADLNSIRKLLGHTTISTTQIYTHLSINDLKAVHKLCHPREMDRE